MIFFTFSVSKSLQGILFFFLNMLIQPLDFMKEIKKIKHRSRKKSLFFRAWQHIDWSLLEYFSNALLQIFVIAFLRCSLSLFSIIWLRTRSATSRNWGSTYFHYLFFILFELVNKPIVRVNLHIWMKLQLIVCFSGRKKPPQTAVAFPSWGKLQSG